MLKITKLNQFYGQSHTLWDLSLEVKKKTGVPTRAQWVKAPTAVAQVSVEVWV